MNKNPKIFVLCYPHFGSLDVWFADVAVSIIRPENLDNLEDGMLPQRWMGKKILPIYNEAGLDMDYEWQIGQVKWWIKNKQ
jgi:hypothetical protein